MQEVAGYVYHVNELKSNYVSGGRIKPYLLEGSYHDFLKEGRFFLLLNQLIGILFAGYEVYYNQMYVAIAIPVIMGIYHFAFYSHIFDSASALSWSNRVNGDREFLTLLMHVYIEAVLGVRGVSEATIGVFPMGDILVSFKKDDVEYFYHVPIEDRIHLEDSIEFVEEEPAA